MKLDDFTNEKVEKGILQELENIQKISRSRDQDFTSFMFSFDSKRAMELTSSYSVNINKKIEN